jgi:hypothetical protein
MLVILLAVVIFASVVGHRAWKKAKSITPAIVVPEPAPVESVSEQVVEQVADVPMKKVRKAQKIKSANVIKK